MNILFIATFPYPKNTGAKIRSYNLLKVLSRFGKVTLLSKVKPDLSSNVESDIAALCEQIIFAPTGSDDDSIKSFDETSFIERVRKIIKMVPWHMHSLLSRQFTSAIKQVNLEKFDLIVTRYAANACCFFYDRQLSKCLDRVVVDIDDITIKKYEAALNSVPMGYSKLLKMIDLFFVKQYYKKLQKARGCFVVSEMDYKYVLERNIAKRCFVIPNILSVNNVLTNYASISTNRLLFVANFEYEPNIEGIVTFCKEVLPLIRASIPNVTLTIIGKNPNGKIFQLAEVEGVVVCANVPDVKIFYDQADVAIIPIYFGGGSRIKVLEAMLYKRPVVSTAFGIEGLDVKHEKHCLIADNFSSFAEYCIKLLRDPRVGYKLSSAAYDLVNSCYTERNMIEKMRSALMQLNFIPTETAQPSVNMRP